MKIYLCGYRSYVNFFYDSIEKAFENKTINETTYNIFTKINDTLCQAFNWFWQKTRFDYVKIDRDDMYSLDYKLSEIILPALVKFRNDNNMSIPLVSNDDVPDGLKVKDDSTFAETENDILIERWNYIMDEMIFSFSEVKKDDILKLNQEQIKRLDNGLFLFGKYYRNLWI